MRLPSQMQRSMRISNKSSEPVVSAEARKLPVLLAIKRTRGYRGPKFPLDRKLARRCNRVAGAVAPFEKPSRANHRVGRTQSIQLDKPLRTRARVRSFVDRNKRCT